MIVLSSLALLKGKKALVTGIANDQSIAVRRCVWIDGVVVKSARWSWALIAARRAAPRKFKRFQNDNIGCGGPQPS